MKNWLAHPRQIMAWLVLIFFLSGFSSLIYQVVWQRLLTLYYGVGDASIAIIVSVYMAGLGLGALAGGFLIERMVHRVRFYVLVEVLIGIFGLVSLPIIEWLGQKTAGSELYLAFFYVFLFLAIPTFLMGMTLPVLTKIFNEFLDDFLETLSLLYFINTLGAAAGALIGSFLLISFFGLDGALLVAVLLNFLLAGMILAIPATAARGDLPSLGSPEVRTGFPVTAAYISVLITGFIAIGYEIVWFRLCGVLVKDSPYAFSSVLAVYLLGIALGSYFMNSLLRHGRIRDRGNLFLQLQVLIGVLAALLVLAYYYGQTGWLGDLSRRSFGITLHPSAPGMGDDFLTSLLKVTDVFLWPAFFMILPTMLMGASFPLVSSLTLTDPHREGKTVGRVYCLNVVGNVLGGLITGFILLPGLGTEHTLLLFALGGVAFGFFVQSVGPLKVPTGLRLGGVATVVLAFVLLFPGRGQLYATMHVPPFKEFDAFLEEGREGVVVTYQNGEKVWCYINGQAHGGRVFAGWYYQTIEAMTYARSVRDVLVIGYGTGSIVEMVLKDPAVKNVTLVEINRTLMKNLRKMPVFQDLLADPRLKIVYDDGRRYLLADRQNYDLVLIDPLRTTTAGSNNLYSREFFSLVSRHLRPGGVFMSYMDEYRVMPKTMAAAYPEIRVYDYFCLGSNMPMLHNLARYNNLMGEFDPRMRPRVAKSGKYVGGREYVAQVAGNYPINTDLNPVSEYYLGLIQYKQ